jgi:hypothetical protein
MNNCGACTGETNTKLCHDHTTKLEEQLAEVDDVVENIRISIERQDVGAASIGGGGPAGSKPPVNLDALDTYEQLRAVITGWAVALQGRTFYVLVKTEEAASYLFSSIELIRTTEWVYELLDELTEAMTRARAATDRALDRISLGPCTQTFNEIRCGDTVTAITGAAIGRCKTCGAKVDVRAHQQALISEAWHVQAPLPNILRALRQSGHLTVPQKRVEHWVQRGTLLPAGRGKFTPAAVMEAHRNSRAGRKEHEQKLRTVA